MENIRISLYLSQDVRPFVSYQGEYVVNAYEVECEICQIILGKFVIQTANDRHYVNEDVWLQVESRPGPGG